MLEQGFRVKARNPCSFSEPNVHRMTRCLLALGANLGDRAATLAHAVQLIAGLPHTQLLTRSSWYETAPVGGPAEQPAFLNGAVLVDTSLEPQKLARLLRDLETQLGRTRHQRWDARTIDIDICLMGERVINEPNLQIPHPRMEFRSFVLAPAAEIAGEMVHPRTGWTIAALFEHWQTKPRKVGVFSREPQHAEWLSQELSQRLKPEGRDQGGPAAIELVSASEQPTMLIALDDTGPRQGPVVPISTQDRELILHESLAAIHAAWPP